MKKMDERCIQEKGLIRVSSRQLSMLWLETSDCCGVADIIDIKQPDNFTDELSWSVFDRPSDNT